MLARPASSQLDEPESFLEGDTDPFGWGGDFDEEHHIVSNQELLCFSSEQMDLCAVVNSGLHVLPAGDFAMDDELVRVNTVEGTPDQGQSATANTSNSDTECNEKCAATATNAAGRAQIHAGP